MSEKSRLDRMITKISSQNQLIHARKTNKMIMGLEFTESISKVSLMISFSEEFLKNLSKIDKKSDVVSWSSFESRLKEWRVAQEIFD